MVELHSLFVNGHVNNIIFGSHLTSNKTFFEKSRVKILSHVLEISYSYRVNEFQIITANRLINQQYVASYSSRLSCIMI